MPIPYHTHKFEIESATNEEVKEGILDNKVVAPSSLGSAAAYSMSDFATAAQGKKADEAVAKRDVGALAYKDTVTVNDINTSGDPSENTVLSGTGWVKLSPLGIGDMSAAIYDPTHVRSDAFSMENMVEGDTKKILTAEERKKLQWLSSECPTIEKWKKADEDINYPISPVDLKDTITHFALSKSLAMSKSVYDPDKIAKDVFAMDHMKEGEKHLILTPQERIQITKIDQIEETAQQAQTTAQCGVNLAGETKEIAENALSIAKDAQSTAVAAQETADKAQKAVDLIHPLEKQDWINGIKTENALISPAHLVASIKANAGSGNGGSSNSVGVGISKPVEIFMTESGEIAWPEGTTEDTELEIWAWGGGNAGDNSARCGGNGGCCVYVRTKKKFLGDSKVTIGKGGGTAENSSFAGKNTKVGQFITASGGSFGYDPSGIHGAKGDNGADAEDQNGIGGDGKNGEVGRIGGFGGNGGEGGKGGKNGTGGQGGRGGRGGDNFLKSAGNGGRGGEGGRGENGGKGGGGGDGGNSIYNCGGVGGWGGHGGWVSSSKSGLGGEGGWGGKGGNSMWGGGGGGSVGGKGGDCDQGIGGKGGMGGNGGDSVYGGAGGGAGGGLGGKGKQKGDNGVRGRGGHSMWGGHGGRGSVGIDKSYYGGGGGYFPGEDATSLSSGAGGDGAVLIKVYL
ncbi:hypothetical protein [Bartonella schoenbuchensis]|uniref:Uncharacterized protein n=1 Tax=Bartonella schoenbuchensis (strain DSM 13525 / NCTC 13165 / R1) TaxID=687861 RepID=E6YZ14_BARSR|nr:hypothetical protein [Bartonella schoenbuchensis]AQX30206.1 hypothetical protein BscR1v2_002510 [Bartonella schoenbuchensis R1]CBI81754.1 conserved hypothetical protein [Bartonella schoenbuchensis R1]